MTRLLDCTLCGAGFRGRSDALYCSSACRQKAHRGRAARRIAALSATPAETDPNRPVSRRPDVAHTIERARREQSRARALCRLAIDTQHRALLSHQRSRTRSQNAAGEAVPRPPWSGWAAIDRAAGGRS